MGGFLSNLGLLSRLGGTANAAGAGAAASPAGGGFGAALNSLRQGGGIMGAIQAGQGPQSAAAPPANVPMLPTMGSNASGIASLPSTGDLGGPAPSLPAVGSNMAGLQAQPAGVAAQQPGAAPGGFQNYLQGLLGGRPQQPTPAGAQQPQNRQPQNPFASAGPGLQQLAQPGPIQTPQAQVATGQPPSQQWQQMLAQMRQGGGGRGY